MEIDADRLADTDSYALLNDRFEARGLRGDVVEGGIEAIELVTSLSVSIRDVARTPGHAHNPIIFSDL